MAEFQIDAKTGTLTLPDGRTLNSASSPEQFKTGPPGSAPLTTQAANRAFYRFPNGAGDGTLLLVNPQFNGRSLARVDISVDLDPGGSKDWSNYSLEVEASIKRFHELHLEKMFGTATKGGPAPDEKDTLEKPLRWIFPWGEVASFHDTKGGGTYIAIFYK